MRRIPIINFSENKVFKTKLVSNQQKYNSSIKKIDNSIQVSVNDNSTPISTSTDISSSQVQTKTDINNQPVDDIYYDEIIYYDGGGVEGYGD